MLVLGAGPAGSAAAIALARRGVDVLLIDRATFPRDKVCGDALIPDALSALASLGLRDTVLAQALQLDGIALYGPNGRATVLEGHSAVVPRLVLDNLLRTAAVTAGARFLAPYSAVAPIVRQSHYRGARLVRRHDDEAIDVEARWTILATGAASGVLRSFGVMSRLEPSATAGRVYLRVPADFASSLRHLAISYDRRIAPGYGWVFPGPGGVINAGVGVFHDAKRRAGRINLRTTIASFLETFDLARAAAKVALSSTRFVGAPLRTALAGATLSKPGLLVVGEAAGATYSFTGEGIGKALETGMLAASIAYDALDGHDVAPEEAAATYIRRVEQEFRARFRAYRTAQDYLAYPALADFLVRRSNAGTFVRSQLEGMLNETADPTRLFSVRGLVRALFH